MYKNMIDLWSILCRSSTFASDYTKKSLEHFVRNSGSTNYIGDHSWSYFVKYYIVKVRLTVSRTFDPSNGLVRSRSLGNSLSSVREWRLRHFIKTFTHLREIYERNKIVPLCLYLSECLLIQNILTYAFLK